MGMHVKGSKWHPRMCARVRVATAKSHSIESMRMGKLLRNRRRVVVRWEKGRSVHEGYRYECRLEELASCTLSAMPPRHVQGSKAPRICLCRG